MQILTAQDLAYAIQRNQRPDLTARPWQYQAAADTQWWLVPSSEWPAYRHGKYLFSLAKDSPRKALLGPQNELMEVDKVFAGVNVEKGYGPLAMEVDPGLRRRRQQLIDPAWLWHRLITENGAREFGELLSEVSTRRSTHLYVVASYVHDPEADAHPRDGLLFSCQRTGLIPILSNPLPVGALRGCETMTTFPDLAARLRQVDEYYWVDVYAGSYVSRGEVNVDALYKDYLSHFEPWVVEAPRR